MLTEISDYIGMEVYTNKGITLGNIDDLIVETDSQKIEGLYISNPNPLLVEHSRAVSVPYRWIQHVGDIVILKYFPKFVRTAPTPERVPKLRKMAQDVKHMAHATEEKILEAEHHAVERIDKITHHKKEEVEE